MDSDNRLYFSETVSNWTNGIEKCNSFPGFQLGIYNSETAAAVMKSYNLGTYYFCLYLNWSKNYFTEMFVNLKKINNQYMWGDGSILDDNAIPGGISEIFDTQKEIRIYTKFEPELNRYRLLNGFYRNLILCQSMQPFNL